MCGEPTVVAYTLPIFQAVHIRYVPMCIHVPWCTNLFLSEAVVVGALGYYQICPSSKNITG